MFEINPYQITFNNESAVHFCDKVTIFDLTERKLTEIKTFLCIMYHIKMTIKGIRNVVEQNEEKF